MGARLRSYQLTRNPHLVAEDVVHVLPVPLASSVQLDLSRGTEESDAELKDVRAVLLIRQFDDLVGVVLGTVLEDLWQIELNELADLRLLDGDSSGCAAS